MSPVPQREYNEIKPAIYIRDCPRISDCTWIEENDLDVNVGSILMLDESQMMYQYLEIYLKWFNLA